MLSPVKNINFKNINFKNQTCENRKNAPRKIEQNPYQINSIYSNINFRGYTPIYQKPSFEETLDYNYFQLPRITLADGTKYQFQPDESQVECAKALYDDKSVFFDAPTGTGKTAPIHYVINKNLQDGKKTYILFPLKALTNDKCREFFDKYGKENIGILTGDIKQNTQAPVLLMTTEIYNNMTQNLGALSSEGTVIYDEAHYLGDYDRGSVWEYSIINTPHDKLQSMLLSATVGNSEEITSWIQSLYPQREVQEIKVPKEDRYVPLVGYIYNNQPKDLNSRFVALDDAMINLAQIDPSNLTSKQKRAMEIIYKHNNQIDGFVVLDDEQYKIIAQEFLDLNKDQKDFNLAEFKKKIADLYPDLDQEKIEEFSHLLLNSSTKTINKTRVAKFENDFAKLISDMQAKNMLPAILFRFSQMGCREIVEELKTSELDLTTSEEKEEIEKIIEEYQKTTYLGNSFDKEGLLRGFGVHHADELPSYKKLVEELYAKKLVKVVCATSTLSAGINMPTKTVVVLDCTHPQYNPDTKEVEYKELDQNQLHQIIGRAGRRGIDNIGYYVLYNLKSDKKTDLSKSSELEVAYKLLESSPKDLINHISPNWVLMSDCFYQKDGEVELEKLISKSFSVFHAQDKEERKRFLLTKFKKYENVLIKNGFLKQEKNGSTTLTPKGEILRLSSSSNPLLLASLVYDEKLKDVDVYELCQIIGHLASSSNQEEEKFMPTLIENKLKSLIPEDALTKEKLKQFSEIRKKIIKTETGLIRSQKEQRINPDKIIQTDTFGGYITYAFAFLNDINPYSVVNFNKITNTEIPKQNIKKVGDSAGEYNRKIKEGNVYDIIAKSYSILKRIEDICEYALSDSQKFKNQQYYEQLRETAQLAQLLIFQKPIYDETSL